MSSVWHKMFHLSRGNARIAPRTRGARSAWVSHERSLQYAFDTPRRQDDCSAVHQRAPSAQRGSDCSQITFAVGLYQGDELVGVATAGRPVARALCDGFTLEINRSCLEGEVDNGNSRLYGALCRAAKALGYRKVITYTLHSESGASLLASGFERAADIGARSWQDSSVARPRYDSNLFGERNNAANESKWRWERVLSRERVAA